MFLESVPVQGTERIAELLYLLIRFIRPRTVLEAGPHASSVSAIVERLPTLL